MDNDHGWKNFQNILHAQSVENLQLTWLGINQLQNMINDASDILK